MREAPGLRPGPRVLRYDEASKELILRFKHADRTGSAPAFAAGWRAPAPSCWRRPI